MPAFALLLILAAAAPRVSSEPVEGAYGLRLGAPAGEAELRALGYGRDGSHWSRRDGAEEIHVFTGPGGESGGERIVAIDSRRIFTAENGGAAFYKCQVKRDSVVFKLRREDRRLKTVGEGSDNYGAFIASYTDLGADPEGGGGGDQRWIRVQCYRARDADTTELHVSWELGERDRPDLSKEKVETPSIPTT